MAPAAAAEQSHVYVTLLQCITSLEVDWDKFAAEVGIKAKGNAQRKLKEALKKDGLQLSGGKIFPLDAETPPAKNKRKKDDGDEDGEEGTPSKKKGFKGKTKNEQEDSDEAA